MRPPPGTLVLVGVTAALTAIGVWGEFVGRLMVAGKDSPVPIPALFTNAFVNLGDSPFPFIVFALITAYFSQDLLRWLWYRRRAELIGAVVGTLVVLYLVNRFVLPGVWGLATSVLVLSWFGTAVERRWGAQRLLLFSFWVMLATNLLAGLVLYFWPGSERALVTRDLSVPVGDGALTTALITAWVAMLGRQRLALLRIEAYKLVWVLVAFGVLEFLFVSQGVGLYTLAGVVIARLLIGGTWRPDRWYNEFRLWRLRRRNARRRAEFKVIPGDKGRDRPTFHRKGMEPS
jgi:hypothetical protein